MDSGISTLFRAASEPVRLRLLNLLRERDHCVCELQEFLQMPQPTISRHLAVLRHAGLVRDKREGPRVIYSLAPAEAELQQAFCDFLGRVCALDPALRRDVRAARKASPDKRTIVETKGGAARMVRGA